MRSLSGRSRRSGARPVRSSSVSAAGKLEQGERIAAGGADEVLAHDRGQRAVEQRSGVGGAQPGEPQLGQPMGIELPRIAVARPDEHRDRIGLQSPRDEHERLGRRAVEPVRVVDDAQQRLRVGGRREQAQDRHRDEEAVLDALVRQPEGAPQRGALHVGQLAGAVEERPQQLMQPGEGQLGLGLDAGAGEHPHAVRPRQRVLQQRGLADPGVAAQRRACRCASRLAASEQAVDGRALALSAQQHGPTLRGTRRWD